MIRQPKNNDVLKWNPDFSRYTSERLAKAQEFVDSETIRLMIPYTPMNTGYLANNAPTVNTVIGSGRIEYEAPYARYQYYGHVMVDENGRTFVELHGKKPIVTNRELIYSTHKNEKAGKLWFERMKADHKADILAKAAEIAGGKPG